MPVELEREIPAQTSPFTEKNIFAYSRPSAGDHARPLISAPDSEHDLLQVRIWSAFPVEATSRDTRQCSRTFLIPAPPASYRCKTVPIAKCSLTEGLEDVKRKWRFEPRD